MNSRCISRTKAIAFALAWVSALVSNAQAADSTNAPEPAITNASPSTRQLGRSPVETFRKLLAMSQEERASHLQLYPPPLHERVIAKIEEYQMLPEPFRELRLQVTELRWYLLPLLKTPVGERPARLGTIPEPYRTWVSERLGQWDMMPPSLREEMLEYESLLDRFVSGNVDAPMPVAVAGEADDRFAEEGKLRRWQSLPLAQRQQIYGSLKRYLDLNEAERNRTLRALSEPERAQTARALESIERWPRSEQERYIAAFQQYAEMSPQERQQFLRNAQRWQRMTTAEREAWRDLVKILSDTPPVPPEFPVSRGGGSGPLETPRTNPSVAAPFP